jgi:hypothetical protein
MDNVHEVCHLNTTKMFVTFTIQKNVIKHLLIFYHHKNITSPDVAHQA